MNIMSLLSKTIKKAMLAAGAPANSDPQVRYSTKPSFGNYQANGIMRIAKQLDIPPRILAERVVALIELENIDCTFDILDPGFINIFIDVKWITEQLKRILFSPKLGVSTFRKKTIVVDYSSPNLAKEMHVGHMRSTIIGDASVRTLEFLGHRVIRANHVGDWGTQFGMLIAYLERIQYNREVEIDLSQLEYFYRAAKKDYDHDARFADQARMAVVKLQKGDPDCLKIWRKLVKITIAQNHKIYERLKVTLTDADIMGESIYNSMLPTIIADLKEKGIAVENDGAIVVFLEEFKNKKGDPMGVIIQKKDGAYLYTTTDIACAKYRYKTLQADRIIYYTDSRQRQHLMQVWTIVRKAGYVPESVIIEHHPFGIILGKDGTPFKTREGDTVKITTLLDEALERTRRLIKRKNTEINPDELEKLAQIVSIGSVKYAELSKNRTTDYIFNWNTMLNFEGNTALYMQYAYSRVISLCKRSGWDDQGDGKIQDGKIQLELEIEIKLAVHLLQFEEAVTTVARDGTPHILCMYIYDLTVLFSSFYEDCPILNAQNTLLRYSRLQLSLITAKTIKQGLDLLGIEVVEKL